MNFQNLEYFICTAEEKNITRAAERLHISQQALSGSISRLEAELNCRLFERRQELELTYSGKCFLKTATQIISLKKQGETLIDDINENRAGELRIGVSHTRGQAILPLVVPKFSRKYPHAEIFITEASSSELEQGLSKGQIDVMIGFMPFLTETAEVKPLIKDRIFLVCPKALLNGKFGEKTESILKSYRKNPDISLFRDLPFVLLRRGERIRTLVDREFAKCGISPVIKTETRNIQTAFSLSAEGMGLSVCPEMYLRSLYTFPGAGESEIKQKVYMLPFVSEETYDTIGIGYIKDRYLSRFAADFIDICEEQFKEL